MSEFTEKNVLENKIVYFNNMSDIQAEKISDLMDQLDEERMHQHELFTKIAFWNQQLSALDP